MHKVRKSLFLGTHRTVWTMVIWVFILGLTHAAVLIVDGENPLASDDHPGTRDKPLKTISHAATMVQPGDEVIVRPGIYREAVALTVSGHEGAPIIFRSEERHAAVICGSDPVTNLQANAPGVWSFSAPHLRRGGVDALQRSVIGDYNNGEWVYVNGAPLDSVPKADLLLPGAFWLDFETRRVQVALPEGLTPDNTKIEFAHRSALFRAGKPLDDIHIIGFKLLHGAGTVQGARTLSAQGQRWLIEDNHILWETSTGLATSWSRLPHVRNNLVEWCGNSGVGGLHHFGLLFESNTVRYCNWRRISPGHSGGASKWVAAVDARIRGNTFYGHYGAAIWCDIANDNVLYEDNVVYASGAAIFSEISWDAIIRGNVVYNNKTGLLVAETCGAVVENNISFYNEYGLRVRGNGRRRLMNYPGWRKQFDDPPVHVSGVDPMTIERWTANYLKFAVSPPHGWMSNNSVFNENLIFENERANYTEFRNYAKTNAMDPFINNFSDDNIWFASDPDAAFHSTDGVYPNGLAGWQAASGRDQDSVEMNPRAAETELPDWAETRRELWDIPVRPFAELVELQLGLVEGPSSAALRDRLSRSAFIVPQPLEDASIKAFHFEIDGERTLALWTTHPRDRRYVRLRVQAKPVSDTLTVENGYLQTTQRAMENGTLDVVVTYLPTYLRGVDESVVERPTSRLIVRGFNPPGRPIQGTAILANDTDLAQRFEASFAVGTNFRIEPKSVERILAAGETAEVTLSITSLETAAEGAGTARMEVKTRPETHEGDIPRPVSSLDRVAGFAFGTGGGIIPAAPGTIVADGNLTDWGTLITEEAPVGLIADKNHIANGDVDAWQGAADASARFYAAWSTQALYFAIIVRDDSVLGAPARATPWSYDAVELFVDGRSYDMQWQMEPSDGCYQIGISPATDGGSPNTQVFRNHLDGLQTASALTSDGYIIEARLPLSRINFPAGDWREGRPIKLSLLLNEKDDPSATSRSLVMGWAFSPKGANFRDTSGWRTLVLAESAVVAVTNQLQILPQVDGDIKSSK